MKAPLVSFEGATKRYREGSRETVALDDVWLEAAEGEYVAIWGERRSGKSTLLRLAAGIELADSGVVRFDGHDLARMPQDARTQLWRTQIGVVATHLDEAFPNRNVRVIEHVAMPLLADRWKPREALAVARRALETVGAASCSELRPAELSLAERTRVAIARGLIRDPRLLVVDEPAGTTSPREQDEIRALLQSLGETNGLTLIVASEEPAVLRGAGRVVSLSDGRVLTSDRPGTVVPLRDAARGRGDA